MKRPVVCEQYEEIVFTDPTENFHKKLLSFPTPETILPHPLSHQTRLLSSFSFFLSFDLHHTLAPLFALDRCFSHDCDNEQELRSTKKKIWKRSSLQRQRSPQRSSVCRPFSLMLRVRSSTSNPTCLFLFLSPDQTLVSCCSIKSSSSNRRHHQTDQTTKIEGGCKGKKKRMED